ncbi:hypothetical protein N7461_003641 [Penicillium sp. DV-2018c]|nr:hypothetical protein N7461_003641 [Penicillium sp. DV-2018c]
MSQHVEMDFRKVKVIIASGGTEEELSQALHESDTDPRELVDPYRQSALSFRPQSRVEGLLCRCLW